MPIPSTLSRDLHTFVLCVISTLSVSACTDADIHPLGMAGPPETHGSVSFAEGFSTVPQLLTEHGLAQEGAIEAEAWWDSWTMAGPEGPQLRSKIYPSAAQRLYPVLGLAGVQDVLDRNSVAVSAVQAVGDLIGSEAVSQALGRARGLHSDSWRALGRGEGEAALRLALRTADALWEVSPQQVAADLIDQAQDALGRKPGSGSYSQEELIRIRRLLYGASEALDQGDYPRAIRRAYYALQLLGTDPA